MLTHLITAAWRPAVHGRTAQAPQPSDPASEAETPPWPSRPTLHPAPLTRSAPDPDPQLAHNPPNAGRRVAWCKYLSVPRANIPVTGGEGRPPGVALIFVWTAACREPPGGMGACTQAGRQAVLQDRCRSFALLPRQALGLASRVAWGSRAGHQPITATEGPASAVSGCGPWRYGAHNSGPRGPRPSRTPSHHCTCLSHFPARQTSRSAAPRPLARLSLLSPITFLARRRRHRPVAGAASRHRAQCAAWAASAQCCGTLAGGREGLVLSRLPEGCRVE
jgi:hypothetical protein